MIFALGELQEQTLPADRDPDWTRLVQNGELTEAINGAFTLPRRSSLDASDISLAEDLKTILTLSSTGWCR